MTFNGKCTRGCTRQTILGMDFERLGESWYDKSADDDRSVRQCKHCKFLVLVERGRPGPWGEKDQRFIYALKTGKNINHETQLEDL